MGSHAPVSRLQTLKPGSGCAARSLTLGGRAVTGALSTSLERSEHASRQTQGHDIAGSFFYDAAHGARNNDHARCFCVGESVCCLRDRGPYEFMSMMNFAEYELHVRLSSDLILGVVGGVVVCSKCRYDYHGDYRVVWELCDPGVFDRVLGWFQVMTHRRDSTYSDTNA